MVTIAIAEVLIRVFMKTVIEHFHLVGKTKVTVFYEEE